jgi:hypothetical protein
MALLGGLLTLVTLSRVKRINESTSVLVRVEQDKQEKTEDSASTSECDRFILWRLFKVLKSLQGSTFVQKR